MKLFQSRLSLTLAVATLALLGGTARLLAHGQDVPRNAHQTPHQSQHQESHPMVMADGKMVKMARYGGPSYGGAPALNVTVSLITAGGGVENFSVAKALVSMVGEKTVKAEVQKLTKQYGADKVKTWLEVFDFAVKDAARIATEAGVKFPKGDIKGKKLAEALVTAGMDKDGTFYTEYLLDKAVTNGIHHQVMDNIDKKYGTEADGTYHQITNQAMYDLGVALKVKGIKLATFH